MPFISLAMGREAIRLMRARVPGGGGHPIHLLLTVKVPQGEVVESQITGSGAVHRTADTVFIEDAHRTMHQTDPGQTGRNDQACQIAQPGCREASIHRQRQHGQSGDHMQPGSTADQGQVGRPPGHFARDHCTVPQAAWSTMIVIPWNRHHGQAHATDRIQALDQRAVIDFGTIEDVPRDQDRFRPGLTAATWPRASADPEAGFPQARLAFGLNDPFGGEAATEMPNQRYARTSCVLSGKHQE